MNYYKVTCTNCKRVEHHKHQTDFSTTRCNYCNSVAFGLKEYHKEYHWQAALKQETNDEDNSHDCMLTDTWERGCCVVCGTPYHKAALKQEDEDDD